VLCRFLHLFQYAFSELTPALQPATDDDVSTDARSRANSKFEALDRVIPSGTLEELVSALADDNLPDWKYVSNVLREKFHPFLVLNRSDVCPFTCMRFPV
jgi:hypothetical protein